MFAGPSRRASRAVGTRCVPRAVRPSVLFLVALCRCVTAGSAVSARSEAAREAHLGTETRAHTPADADSAYMSSAVTRPGERTLLSVATNSTLPYSYEPNSSDSYAREGAVDGVLRDGNTSASLGPSAAATDSRHVATQDARSGRFETDSHNATVQVAVTDSALDTYETGRSGSIRSTPLDGGNGTSVSSSTSLLSESGREITPAPMGPPRATDDTEGVRLPTESSGKHGWTAASPVFREVTAAVNTSDVEVWSSQQSVTSAVKQPPNSPGLRSTVPTATMQDTQFTSKVTVPSPASTAVHAPSTAAPQTQLTPSTAPQDHGMTTGLQSTTRASQKMVPSRTGQTDGGGVTASEVQTSSAALGSTARPPRLTAMPFASTSPVRTTVADAAGNTATRRDRVQTAIAQTPITSAAEPENACNPLTCANGGTCVNGGDGRRRCVCLPLWTGHDCTVDVDECISAPCPGDSRCENTRGSFTCECPLGYSLENGRTCTQVKTFLGTFRASAVDLNSTLFGSGGLHEVQREVLQLVNASLSNVRGYIRSTLSKSFGDGARISVVNTFSMAAEVTGENVLESIQMFLNNCNPLVSHCSGILRHKLLYRAESLCATLMTRCDRQRSECTDTNGTIFCQCRSGYFKLSTNDLSCRECDDGFKLENGTCVKCTFGFGGFNCGNFYKLIAVVVSPAGGAVLLIIIIALIVVCCRKGKNDINKIIFKSGDFQMSPYVEYPKSNRVSIEWGKESIELQENGSTKNLLQMTDIYYAPPLRNPEMERHALYPFSGLPGSRHSCIYPVQWNPSFISDDTRRRDYF
ncbi:protein HEG-like isoform X1 [Scleropages formosus]|uniref:protein HEG-like isoform X1 n=2 Tax=Scleropages formosus TaxID=113540 RepID=UPI0010FA7ABF|nr:protein HEG isoform X1 [Scleropages formosus]